MIKNMQAGLLGIIFFVSFISLGMNVSAKSYIEDGNKIINKIYDEITMLKKGHAELSSFDKGALKMSRRDELYISYGEPDKKSGNNETAYIYISYTKLPVGFKGWQYKPSIFYSLEDDLYFGCCLGGKDNLKKDLLMILERTIR